jgi:hypothetical protein
MQQPPDTHARAITNEYLESLGLISLRDRWVEFTTGKEPPYADPHVRWCGEGWLDASPYPI